MFNGVYCAVTLNNLYENTCKKNKSYSTLRILCSPLVSIPRTVESCNKHVSFTHRDRHQVVVMVSKQTTRCTCMSRSGANNSIYFIIKRNNFRPGKKISFYLRLNLLKSSYPIQMSPQWTSDVCTTTTQRVPVANTLGSRCTNVAGSLGLV